MITRRASEIIRLSLTMAQINNTDALSWRDKIDILNQSYVRLYDDLNNAGDLYYVKETLLEKNPENVFPLPDDFWKLLLVGYKSSMGEVVPVERAPNVGQYFSGYRIINNELVFNNSFTPVPFSTGILVVRYLPKPQTLTYPRPGYRLPGKPIQAAYDAANDVIILGELGFITVINNATGKSNSMDIVGMYALAVSGGIIYIVQEDRISCVDFELNQISELAGIFDLYAHSIGWEPGIIIKMNGIPHRYESGGLPEESNDFWNFMDGQIIRAGDTFSFSAPDDVQDITDIFQGADSFVIADPFIYINKSGMVTVYDQLQKTDISPSVIGGGVRKGMVLAGEVNNETGYGVIFRDFYAGVSLVGFASDTVMNYPQNIFFEWLTIDLAIKFRMALDLPTGELPALASDYYDTLMKGMSRDSYMPSRISNLYGRSYL